MSFPRYVYKRGTAKKMNADGLFSAESVLVKSEEELAELGPDWCDSPAEAGEAKQEEKPKEEKPKKVK
jgi:hypothetical protein